MVRVAAVEPDPDTGPVGAGIGTAGLAPGDHPGEYDREGQAEQQDGGDPARIVESRDLAPERPAEDAGPPPRAAIDVIRQVDDDPSATAGRSRNGSEAGRRRRIGHGRAFSHGGPHVPRGAHDGRLATRGGRLGPWNLPARR